MANEIPAHRFHAALTAADLEYAGMSWGGFNLFGDRKSIAEAQRLQHLAGQREALVTEIQTTRALAKQRGEALVTLEKIYAERLADLTAEKERGNLTADFGEAGLRNTTVFLEDIRRAIRFTMTSGMRAEPFNAEKK